MVSTDMVGARIAVSAQLLEVAHEGFHQPHGDRESARSSLLP